ncbi:MAG: hypothetical protein BKP49_00790 [Treponema sp. CETP13]|nr:MAG: hypothetical protein BKP49_00790 [Treponema sp. CETP13]
MISFKNNRRFSFLFLCFCFLPLFAMSESLSFSGLDLNSNNELLFSAKTSSGLYTWNNLYRATLINEKNEIAASKEDPTLLTCFPLKMDVFLEGRFLQIRNNDGVFLYSKNKKTLEKISSSSSLHNSPQNSAKIRDNLANISVSPNGKWICYFERTSPAKGKVLLSNTSTGGKFILAENAEFSFEEIPVIWCPDSSFVVYEKEGHLYFVNPKDAFAENLIDEKYRSIGPGNIGNVKWASSKKLVYISHDLVFSIMTNELYTRALYSELVGVGDICGRLPSAFDGKRDKFWINENCNRIVLVDNQHTLWYMELKKSDSDASYVKTLFSYPFVNVPGTAYNFNIFWSQSSSGEQIPIVWIELFRNGVKESYVYRLVKNTEENYAWFEALPLPSFVHDPQLSPNGKSLAFIANDFIGVYDLVGWKERARFSGENMVSFAWVDSNSMYVGGINTIQYWDYVSDNKNVILLSSANKYAWDGSTGRVLAECYAGNYFYNTETKTWEKTETVISRKTLSRNAFWRAFIDESRNNEYENAIYIRSLSGANTTKPLLQAFYTPDPESKKVALIFDALDNSDGISQILMVLNKYGLKATFFLNGEFIRRFPNVVKEISNSGHECASMFYTVANLTSDTFIPDKKYIMRGLARNEDEFYQLTGKELSLAWHAPSYVYSDIIEEASDEAGYSYVKSSVKTGDTNTIEKAARTGTPYISSGTIVENLAKEFEDKQIIPISCGLSYGTRPDYLYNKLDELVSALLGQGFKIVPVSDVIW